jgi:CRP/FNR family transcriptional regulator, cyclic AMP receptor protein
MAKATSRRAFDVKVFLSTVDGGRSLSNYLKNQKIFVQGDEANSVFYIQDGRVKLSVLSELGKRSSRSVGGETSSARAA